MNQSFSIGISRKKRGIEAVQHLVMPAAAIDPDKRLWRTKQGKKGRKGYLFNHKAVAKVFRAKLLEAISQAGLTLPD